MSGDTPTEHSLDCPDCGSEVFIRDTAAWFTDEDEYCAGCGSRVMVALDEDSADPDLLTARVYVYEHGGDVVARLRAEVGERLSTIAGLEVELEQSTQAEADDAATIERIRAEGLGLDAQLRVETRVRVSAQAEAERLTRERDDAKAEAASYWAERVEEAIVAARAGREAASQRECAETAEREMGVLRELVRAAQHHIPRSWPQWPAWAKRAFDVLGSEFALSGSGDFEDSTTDETGGDQ